MTLTDNASSGVRAFLAVRLPHEQALILHQQVAAHFAGVASLRRVAPEQLHITLRFLGKSYLQQLNHIVTILDGELNRFAPFAVSTGRLCIFPDRHRPRVMALAVKDGQTLKRLADICEQAVVQCGFAAETRRYRGHITLGRFRRWHSSLPDPFVQLPGYVFPVAQVELLASVNVHRAGSQTVEYKTIHVFKLSR